MSSPTNHWKLGLFVVMGFLVMVACAFFFGARSIATESVTFASFFDESVQGLDVGAPVKFRGVTVGTVTSIDVAADHRHVGVSYDLTSKDLGALGLGSGAPREGSARVPVPPELRVQLVSAGITGVKFLQIDFFEPEAYPPVSLPFKPPENTIPAVASVMKNLENSVVHAMDRVPALSDQLVLVLARVSNLLEDVQAQKLPEKLAVTLNHLDLLLAETQTSLRAMEPGKLSRGLRELLEGLNAALKNINGLLARVGGDKGLLSSAQRATEAVASSAQNADHVGPAVEDALRDVQNAAQAVQRLAESLDRDPSMIIKGRARRREE